MGRRGRHRAPETRYARSVLWVIARKIGTFMLACLVGLVIMILVFLPLAWLIWQLMLYASRQ